MERRRGGTKLSSKYCLKVMAEGLAGEGCGGQLRYIKARKVHKLADVGRTGLAPVSNTTRGAC